MPNRDTANRDTAAHYIATGIVGGFDPLTDDPDIFALWEPSRGVVKDGSDGISSLLGQVGGEGNLDQGVAGDRPLWVSAGLNGLDTMTFDAGNTEHFVSDQASSVWKFMHDGADFTSYILFNITVANPSDRQVLYSTFNSLGTQVGTRFRYDDVAANDSLITTISAATGTPVYQAISPADAFPTQTWGIASVNLDVGAPGDDIALYINNTAEDTSPQTDVPSAANPHATLNIGQRPDGSWPLAASVASIIVSKASHNSTMRANYAGYFLNQFATP